MTTVEVRGPGYPRAWKSFSAHFDIPGLALPIAALIAMFVYSGSVNPATFSYLGLELVLGSAVPLVFASISQAFVIALGDIDLGTGYFVGLANCVVAVILTGSVWWGILALIGLVAAYAVQGFLISWRRIPSITFTLGTAFIWLGVGMAIAPTPRGSTPPWLAALFAYQTPLLPLSAWLVILGALAAYAIFFRTKIGLLIRAVGSNEVAYTANGVDARRVKIAAYTFAGAFGVLAAIAETGVTGTGDPTASSNYTLLAIAGVILGGASFAGGKMSAVGIVCGALVLSMVGSILAQLNISSNFQTAVEGVVLLVAIAGRRLLSRRRA